MAPNSRAVMAFKAMRALGISEEAVKPVLKNLLKLYDKNWALIEEENYRVLADAIFDNSEDKLPGNAKESPVHAEAEDNSMQEVESPLRRSSLKRCQDQRTPDDDVKTFTRRKRAFDSPAIVILDEESNKSQLPLERRNLQVGGKGQASALSPQNSHGQEMVDIKPFQSPTYFMGTGKGHFQSPQAYSRLDRAEHSKPCNQGRTINPIDVVTQPECLNRNEADQSQYTCKQKSIVSKESSSKYQVKESVVQPLAVEFSHQHCQDKPLIKPEIKEYEEHGPLAVIYPPCKGTTRTDEDGRSSASNAVTRHEVGKNGGHGNAVAGHDVGKNGGHGNAVTRHEVGKNGGHVDAVPQSDIVEDEGHGVADTGRLELATSSAESLQNFEIASTPLGEVKINMSWNFANRSPGFHVPSVEDVLKRVEDKYLHLYKTVDPNFSITNLMKEMCQCFLQLGTSAAEDKVEHRIESTETSKISPLKNSDLQKDIVVRSNLDMPASPIDSLDSDSLHKMFGTNIPKILPLNNLGDRRIMLDMRNVPHELYQSSNPLSLVPVHQNMLTHDGAQPQPLHNVDDISKGEEKVKISVINEVNSWPYPSKFYYIPQSIVYQNAYVNFSLARIGDENCCMNCFNDCIASSISCACARETGGEFAYTSEGLVKQEFLDGFISMKHNPQKHEFFYCKECPLERSRNEDIRDPCQGHLVKKFIKECWSKCGCSKYCGNRVVQRGINKNLQVFFTQEGKGWGLRTLESLPRGTFVCEYVGEILTNIELYERNTRTSNEEHTYPVLLDADWGSEGILKDEEALCLDATSYGNVARFINHRCHDANLIEIPVEIESPDHHYYHLAFFTTRNVDPLEELCWDYGIDFEDQNHPIKAFSCKCGSNGCRDRRVRPRKRSKQTPLVLG